MLGELSQRVTRAQDVAAMRAERPHHGWVDLPCAPALARVGCRMPSPFPLLPLVPCPTLSLSRRADKRRHGSHRVELAPPLSFPTRQATTAVAACANIFAIPFSLLCACLGRLARSRSAAALSRVAMAELRTATAILGL
jgi:hypothetical protein